MNIEFHLRAAGCLLLLLAALHPLLPKQLDWKNDLGKLALVNRQIFLVHVAFIVLLLVLPGLLALCFAPELAARSPLARAVLGGLALFWGLRLGTQLFVYDRRLWRGNARNTAVHVAAVLLWIYLTVVFGWGFWSQSSGG
jgi:hypothetical protein